MTLKLLWTVLVSGAVIALGLSLVLRWLGAAGLPVPLASRTPDSVRYAVSRAEGLRVFLSALLFRLVIFVLVGLFTCLVLQPDSGPDAALWTWKRWDALHYVNLAELGYTGYVEDGKHLFLVFFPLYPWLMRLVSAITGNTMAAGLLISFLTYAGGCVYLYRLAAWELGEGAARRAVLFLSIFPYAFFFGGIMTEGLFLFTTAAGLWYIRRHRWWLAGVFGVLAAMTRMHGILLIGAAAAELVEDRGRFDWREIGRRLPALLLPVLGTLVYLALNWQVGGDPFAFTVMQEHWSQGFCWISDTLWYVLNNALSYPTQAVRYQLWLPTILLFPIFFALVLYARKKFRSMYVLYGFVYLVLNYSLSWLLSAGRYLSCGLPFFLFAAALTENRRWLTILLSAAMSIGFLLLLYGYLTGGQIM